MSVSLSCELLERIDRQATETGSTRSAVMEKWLADADRLLAQQRVAAEVEAYYQGRSAEERREDEAIAAASGRQARSLDLDGVPEPEPSR